MITVTREGEENLERMLRRFKREVEREGIIKEVKERQYFEKPSLERHKKEVSKTHKRKKYSKKSFE